MPGLTGYEASQKIRNAASTTSETSVKERSKQIGNSVRPLRKRREALWELEENNGDRDHQDLIAVGADSFPTGTYQLEAGSQARGKAPLPAEVNTRIGQRRAWHP